MVLFLLLIFFGFSSIPFGYVVSGFCNSPTTGFVSLVTFFMLFGFFVNCSESSQYLLIKLQDPDSSMGVAINFFRLIPLFSFLFGFQKMYIVGSLSKTCKKPIVQMTYCLNSTFAFILGKDDDGGVNVSDFNKIYKGCCVDTCGDRCLTTRHPFSTGDYGAGVEIIYMLLIGLVFIIGVILYDRKYSLLLELFQVETVYNFRKQLLLSSTLGQKSSSESGQIGQKD